ncbi:hypothetical protein HDU76_010465, partial [Blyttiomyces sp. JEL0837]
IKEVSGNSDILMQGIKIAKEKRYMEVGRFLEWILLKYGIKVLEEKGDMEAVQRMKRVADLGERAKLW